MTQVKDKMSLATKFILVSGKAQHGKDTFADTIINTCYGVSQKAEVPLIRVKKLAFAQQLKTIASDLCWDGRKNTKGRTFLQWLGDGAREYDPNVWIKLWNKEAQKLIVVDKEEYFKYMLCGWQYIIIPDTRYYNEIEKLKQMYPGSCITVRVNRVNFDNGLTEEQNLHKSETDLDSYRHWDYTLTNDVLLDYKQKSISVFSQIVQAEIPQIVDWFKDNSLQFNTED
jgi:hypothetical protein